MKLGERKLEVHQLIFDKLACKRKLKQWVILGLSVGLASTLTFGNFTSTALAQENIESLVLNDVGEGASRSLTTNWTPLAPGESHIYTFVHDGADQAMNVWMSAVPVNGVTFQIWNTDGLEAVNQDPATEPVGQGVPMGEGSGFVTWSGTVAEADTFYVIVTSTGDANTQYLLNISSPALAVEQPGAIAEDAAAPAPAATPDPTVAVVTTNALNVRSGPSTLYPVLITVPNGTEMTVTGRNPLNTWIAVQLADGTEGWVTRSLTSYTNIAPVVETPPLPAATPDPNATTDPNAPPVPGDDVQLSEAQAEEALGDGWRLLSEGESHWYTFQHQGGDLPVHIWMDIEPNEGAGFRVYTEENARAIMAGSNPDDVDDIGRGTTNPVEPGYLFWRGVFEEAGPFYVMVMHGWQDDVYYSIHAAGPGLSRPAPQ